METLLQKERKEEIGTIETGIVQMEMKQSVELEPKTLEVWTCFICILEWVTV